MRHRIVVALSAVLLSLLVAPAINVLSAPSAEAIKWDKKSFLYNMDFLASRVAGLLYSVGVSVLPKEAVVGRDGWLYLGDEHGKTLTVDRRPAGPDDFKSGREISSAMQAWEAYFSGKGVKVFKIMVGPNKGTIYPEYLPAWAKPASPNATDALLAEAQALRYVDLRAPLLAAKARPEKLYYRLDTHWNDLGAGIAFRAFAQEVALAAPELKWLPAAAYDLSRVAPRQGGDLAGLLRLSDRLVDVEPVIHASALRVETMQSDFATGAVIHRGGNPQVQMSAKPVLVKSVGALNNKKVLWLRDSFGSAMAPLMAATFSETLQVHWNQVLRPDGAMEGLMDRWKPEYVFVTVVERNLRDRAFFSYPPGPAAAAR